MWVSKAYPGSKLDSPVRLEQTRAILEAIRSMKSTGPLLICGDFNLLPTTESIRMIAESMQDLVTMFEIPSTRSRINLYYGTPQEQHFADFVFASADVDVMSFSVPQDVEVSDHLPLLLEYKVRSAP